MEIIILTITLTFLGFLSIYGIKLFKTYRNTIYEEIFPTYLEYFYRYRFLKSLASSLYLNQIIGQHHLVYASILNEQKQIMDKFITIISLKGIFVLADTNFMGTIDVNANNDHWLLRKVINTETKTYKIKNPIINLEKHLKYTSNFLELDHNKIHGVVIIHKNSMINKNNTGYPILNFDDFLSLYKDQYTQCFSEDEVNTMFRKFKNNK